MLAPVTSARSQRLRRVRWLYAAETASGMGDGIFWVGLIAAISGATEFTTLLAIAVIARLGPRALFSLPAGGIVDRSNVRMLLVTSDLVRAALMAVLGVAVWRDVSIGWILGGVVVVYLVGVPWRPGLSASLPSVVGESDLASANALISTIRQIMTFVGPLVGVAIAAWSIPAAFLVNGVTFAVSALCIGLVRGVRWPTGARRPHRHRSAAAASTSPASTSPASTSPARASASVGATSADGLATLIALSGLMYLVRGAEMVLHVLVVRDLIGADPTAIGYLGGAVGLGAVLATPLARRAAADDQALLPLLASMALTAIPTALLALSDETSVAAILLLPVGAGMVVFEVVIVVTIQRTVPPTVLGRAFGALNAVTNGGKLIGAVGMPALVALVDVEWSLVIVGGLVVAGALTSVIPLRRVSRRAEQRRGELAPIVERLADLDLFRGATQSSLERLAEYVVQEPLEAGDALIREGEPADDVFVIVDGRFDVSTDGASINALADGDWAGEIGLIEELPRTATVTAVESATVWRIPGELFLAALAGADDTSMLDSDIARRLAAGRSTRSLD